MNNTEYKFDVDLKPNLNYWTNSPIIVQNNIVMSDTNIDTNICTIKQILSNDILLKKIENVIQTHPYKLNYKINEQGLDLNKLCDFINTNYSNENVSNNDNNNDNNIGFKFIYSIDTIKYYIYNSLVISFYSLHTEKYPAKMIGLIIGKKTELFIDTVKYDSVEVNFLTLDPKVRNKNLATLMISILTRETIIKYSIGIAHYTINNPIKAPCYGLKYYFHRMINIKNLFDTKFISDEISNLNKYKIIYNNFKNYLPDQQILYLNKKNISDISLISNEFINFICKNINEYSKKNYKIYEYKTQEQISQLFNSDSFHHFIFIESNSEQVNFKQQDLKNLDLKFIKNYICLNELETLCTINNLSYSNGYIYMGFYTNKLDIIIEKISEYIYLFEDSNKIVDVITWSDLFNVDESCTIAVKGSGFLKYYLYNIQTIPISNHKNGLVTL